MTLTLNGLKHVSKGLAMCINICIDTKIISISHIGPEILKKVYFSNVTKNLEMVAMATQLHSPHPNANPASSSFEFLWLYRSF